MNESPTPLTDEELSLLLDGDADDALVARAETDPDARARLTALADVRDRLTATAPTLDAATADRLIGDALTAPVTPASHRRNGPPPWLVAAAVALLVALGLGLIWSGRSQEDQAALDKADRTVAETADEQSDASTDAGGAGEASAPEASEDPLAGGLDGHSALPSTTVAPPSETGAVTAATVDAGDLGTFATADDLRTALATETVGAAPGTATRAAPSDASYERCARQLEITLELDGPPLVRGSAVVGDREVLVYDWNHRSFEDGQPTVLVTAVGADACDEVAFFER